MRKNVRRIDDRGANAVAGAVVWAPAKSLWNTAMIGLLRLRPAQRLLASSLEVAP